MDWLAETTEILRELERRLATFTLSLLLFTSNLSLNITGKSSGDLGDKPEEEPALRGLPLPSSADSVVPPPCSCCRRGARLGGTPDFIVFFEEREREKSHHEEQEERRK